MWPKLCVKDVVNAMADNHLVVLGLDLRSDGDGVTPAGLATEVPWSAYPHQGPADADPVEGARTAALSALGRSNLGEFDGYAWTLVTWTDLPRFRALRGETRSD
jgi:hypothetical protein